MLAQTGLKVTKSQFTKSLHLCQHSLAWIGKYFSFSSFYCLALVSPPTPTFAFALLRLRNLQVGRTFTFLSHYQPPFTFQRLSQSGALTWWARMRPYLLSPPTLCSLCASDSVLLPVLRLQLCVIALFLSLSFQRVKINSGIMCAWRYLSASHCLSQTCPFRRLDIRSHTERIRLYFGWSLNGQLVSTRHIINNPAPAN